MPALRPAKDDGVMSVDIAPNPKSGKTKKKKTPALDKYRKKKGC
jgi:hypothetical protein